jgi:hypothetical protein
MVAPENPPAFPCAVPIGFQFANDGMTLRDWFAGQALTGWLGHGDTKPGDQMEHSKAYGAMARQVYAMADAMLAERAKVSS